MLRTTRLAGAFAAALALAAAAACTDDAKDGDVPEGAGESFEAPRLIDMVNESNRLLYELEAAEGRIVQACLEDQGFTVHDELYFVSGAFEPAEELVRADDWGSWLPSVEEAAEYGLGTWRFAPEADPDEVEEYMAYKGFEVDSEAMGGGPENGGNQSEFAALDPRDQYDWHVAYQGEAAALDEYGYLIGEESTQPEAREGEVYTGDEFSYMQPEPGGCLREMIDALYDDLRLVEDPEGGEIRGAYWHYRPENPMDDAEAMEDSKVMFHEGIAAVQGELVDCLAEHDRHGWEFDEESSLPVTDYFFELYEGEGSVVGDFPDLPDDAPDDYEGKKAFEIAFAVDLAECGDETGYRETAEEAWVASQESFYVSIETASYAWQEEVKSILTKAQETLES
ncbi:hypothetical protein [Glycomyces tritici]|uniref:Uncharacterized protein n=1 Tax=Glycomyces tritici TaxID=2665176 RepID=A0ABT7YQW5_9ACTN|nr:hypothetical protein [Glycomyces tritici]MDN3241045.1 hypothetical protein [Glycomyces tritici]